MYRLCRSISIATGFVLMGKTLAALGLKIGHLPNCGGGSIRPRRG